MSDQPKVTELVAAVLVRDFHKTKDWKTFLDSVSSNSQQYGRHSSVPRLNFLTQIKDELVKRDFHITFGESD